MRFSKAKLTVDYLKLWRNIIVSTDYFFSRHYILFRLLLMYLIFIVIVFYLFSCHCLLLSFIFPRLQLIKIFVSYY